MYNVLNSAMKYLDLGWKVFPVHSVIDNRCTCGILECSNIGKHPATHQGFKNATMDPTQIDHWFREGHRNIGLPTGAENNLVVIDVDPRHGGHFSLEELINEIGDFRDTLSAKTGGGGYHYFFKYPEDEVIKSGANIRPGIDVRADGGYVVVEPSIHQSGQPYMFDVEDQIDPELIKDLPESLMRMLVTKPTIFTVPNTSQLKEGQRNQGLTSLAGKLRKCGLGKDGLKAALNAENNSICVPPLSSHEVGTIAESISKYPTGIVTVPKPTLDPLAYYGPIGSLVKKVTPITEAHPAAILIQLLTAFGNIIGPSAFFNVGPTKHAPILFVCVVGRTARARKGLSWSIAKFFAGLIDENWTMDRLESGLSSGEGLIDKIQTLSEKENDPRLLVVESEFANVLMQQHRSGNTLSSVLRKAWDGESLQAMTKNDPLSVAEHHTSVVAHITMTELDKLLTDADRYNGLGNRFLWCFVDREKLLPAPPALKEEDYDLEIDQLTIALEFSKNVGSIGMTDDAKERWNDIYYELNQDGDPLIDALTTRGEPYVRRIAMIHAIQDCSNTITVDHLNAAYALWKYCYQSTRFIFGAKGLSAKQQKLFDCISDTHEGLTKTECHKVFNNHMKKEQLEQILEYLEEENLIIQCGTKDNPKWKAK